MARYWGKATAITREGGGRGKLKGRRGGAGEVMRRRFGKKGAGGGGRGRRGWSELGEKATAVTLEA